MGSLQGRVAIVTGAGRGIGRAIALRLARDGADVVIAEVDMQAARSVVEEIEALGRKALAVEVDVSRKPQVQDMAQRTLDEWNHIDILVNNAIIYRTGSILEIPIETWDQVYAVNLRGAVVAIRTFLPGMLERKEVIIVTCLLYTSPSPRD